MDEMLHVYLDTCIPIMPFNEPLPLFGSDEWLEQRKELSTSLMTLISQKKLKWSTSDYFFQEFEGLIEGKRVEISKFKHLHSYLKAVYECAKESQRIAESSQINDEADVLIVNSATNEADRLEQMDARHLISAFKLAVENFLTYDHRSMLDRHKGYIDGIGRQSNPAFQCVDPVVADFLNNPRLTA